MEDSKYKGLYYNPAVEFDENGKPKRIPKSKKEFGFDKDGKMVIYKHHNVTDEDRKRRSENMKRVVEEYKKDPNNVLFKPKGDAYSDERRKRGKRSLRRNMKKRVSMQEGLKAILSLPLSDDEVITPEAVKSFLALDGVNVSVQDQLLIAQIRNALAGDTKAFKVLTEVLGEQAQKVEIDLKDSSKSKLDSLLSQFDGHETYDEEDLKEMEEIDDEIKLPDEVK